MICKVTVRGAREKVSDVVPFARAARPLARNVATAHIMLAFDLRKLAIGYGLRIAVKAFRDAWEILNKARGGLRVLRW